MSTDKILSTDSMKIFIKNYFLSNLIPYFILQWIIKKRTLSLSLLLSFSLSLSPSLPPSLPFSVSLTLPSYPSEPHENTYFTGIHDGRRASVRTCLPGCSVRRLAPSTKRSLFVGPSDPSPVPRVIPTLHHTLFSVPFPLLLFLFLILFFFFLLSFLFLFLLLVSSLPLLDGYTRMQRSKRGAASTSSHGLTRTIECTRSFIPFHLYSRFAIKHT